MHHTPAFHLSVILWILTGLVTVSAGGTNNMLEEFRWKNRPVIAFTPDANKALLYEQNQIFQAESACIRERDMLLIEVVGSHVQMEGKRRPDLVADALRERFSVAPHETAFVLVGKDGRAKLRSDTPLSTDILFGTIDAMPMRAREAREHHSVAC